MGSFSLGQCSTGGVLWLLCSYYLLNSPAVFFLRKWDAVWSINFQWSTETKLLWNQQEYTFAPRLLPCPWVLVDQHELGVWLLAPLLLAHSCEMTQMETAWISRKSSLVSTLSNTFFWNKLQCPVWEKVTLGPWQAQLISTNFTYNIILYQHFPFCVFIPLQGLSVAVLKIPVIFSNKAQQVPLNQQQQCHSKKQ